jgi:predicted aspartyl protease
MPRTSPPLKFVFDYKRFHCRIPIIPVRFIRNDNVSTQIINAVLDSGADAITIPKDLAVWLQLKLEPRDTPAMTAAGTIKAYKAIVPGFVLGQGGREVNYKNIEVCVMENCPYILVGISPVFEDYIVIINAYQNKFTLEPRQ